MDYGDRQARAEMLVKAFRARGSKTIRSPRGQILTCEAVAVEIEGMTDLGRDLVAVAGLVLHAMQATPEFFENQAALDKSP
jgi:hypothetical protein